MTRFRKFVTAIPLLLSFVAVSILSPTLAFAQEGTNVSTVSKINDKAVQGVMNGSDEQTQDSTGSTGTNKVKMDDIDGSNYIPDTTIVDANNLVSEKGEDLIGLGATIAEPIAIIAFMFGLAITLLGAMTKSSHLAKGLLVMAISIIAYVGAVFAPEIVHYFSTWLSS